MVLFFERYDICYHLLLNGALSTVSNKELTEKTDIEKPTDDYLVLSKIKFNKICYPR